MVVFKSRPGTSARPENWNCAAEIWSVENAEDAQGSVTLDVLLAKLFPTTVWCYTNLPNLSGWKRFIISHAVGQRLGVLWLWFLFIHSSFLWMAFSRVSTSLVLRLVAKIEQHLALKVLDLIILSSSLLTTLISWSLNISAFIGYAIPRFPYVFFSWFPNLLVSLCPDFQLACSLGFLIS